VATIDSTIALLAAIEQSARMATKRIDELTRATEQLFTAMTMASDIEAVSQEALNLQQRMIRYFETFIGTIQQTVSEFGRFIRQVSAGHISVLGLIALFGRLVFLSSVFSLNMRNAGTNAGLLQGSVNQAQGLTQAVNSLMGTLNQVLGIIRQINGCFETLDRAARTFLDSIRDALAPLRKILDNLQEISHLTTRASDQMRQFTRQAMSAGDSVNDLVSPLNRLADLIHSLRSNMREISNSAEFFREADDQARGLRRSIDQLLGSIEHVQNVLQQVIRSFNTLNRAATTFRNHIRDVLAAVRQIREALDGIDNLSDRAADQIGQFARQAIAGGNAIQGMVAPMSQLVSMSNTLSSNMQQVSRHAQTASSVSGQQGQSSQNANAGQSSNAGRQGSAGQTVLKSMLTMVKRSVSNLISEQNLKSAMKFSDNYMNSIARISAVNDGTESDKELQAKIYAAANRSRGRYMEMTEYVARLGLAAPQVFSGNDEVVAFAELAQKAFRLGGSGADRQQAGMEQLIQSMSMGRLQGDDFLMILDTAPELAGAIASFTGKSIEELIRLAEEGGIASGILKGALLSAADEINRKFEELPKTFGDIQNQLSVLATAAFGPVIERVNEFLNSADGQRLITGISQAIQVAAAAIGSLIDGVAAVISFVTENWSIIEPILIAIGTVWLGLIIAQLWAMAAAWLAINWPVLLLVAIIALVIYALVKLGVTAEQIVGAIVGAFAVAGAFIWNVIAGVVNAIIQHLWSFFVEPFLGIIEWFINAFQGGFDSFGDAVSNLIGQIISWFLSLGKIVTKIIDAIFGTDWTAGLEALQNQVLGWGKNDKAVTISRDAPIALDRIGYRDAWDAGYEAGGNLVNSVQNALKGFDLDKMLNFGAEDGIGQGFDNLGADTSHIDNIDKVGEVGRIGDTVDISSEDLKMMRELAEMNAIQNFVTLTPTVNVQTGDIRNGYDVDTIIRRIEQSLTEQIASSAQGVYGLG